jgi:uncharacterized protein YecE (DUF72 family)
MQVYIGSSGWSYPDWKGVFYPLNLSIRNYLSYYANHFNTLEINSTFYHFPTAKSVHAWKQQVPDTFKFSLRVSRLITHTQRMKQVQEPLQRFYGLQEILQDKLGYFLSQFPASFRCSEENIKQLLSQVDPLYHHVMEFPHPSWWKDQVVHRLQEHHIIFCTVSGFGLPEELIATQGVAYIRFHGEPTYEVCYTKAA